MYKYIVYTYYIIQIGPWTTQRLGELTPCAVENPSIVLDSPKTEPLIASCWPDALLIA